MSGSLVGASAGSPHAQLARAPCSDTRLGGGRRSNGESVRRKRSRYRLRLLCVYTESRAFAFIFRSLVSPVCLQNSGRL